MAAVPDGFGSLAGPLRTMPGAATMSQACARLPLAETSFTDAAGIHLYTRLHRRPPAEADIRQYFQVTPPSVHQMIVTLERAGFIRRQPRVARSIELLVDPKHLPELL